MTTTDLLSALDRDGFALLRGAFTAADCDRLLAEWAAACVTGEEGLMRSATGAVYGARNILDRWPAALGVVQQPMLAEALRAALEPGFGLVRVLYFDKPPGESWALPWHRDLTIAVNDNGLPSERFTKPTRKAGVPHVEAPRDVLEKMLTLRIHLDDVTDENGPLLVIPGSHRNDEADRPPVTIHARRGDVLVMRPLVSHSSPRSAPGTQLHRRILHLEFAAEPELGDGFAWHTFIPGSPPPQA